MRKTPICSILIVGLVAGAQADYDPQPLEAAVREDFATCTPNEKFWPADVVDRGGERHWHSPSTNAQGMVRTEGGEYYLDLENAESLAFSALPCPRVGGVPQFEDVRISNRTYFAANVRLVPLEDAPELDPKDKVGVWLHEIVGSSPVLRVSAGCYTNGLRGTAARDYAITNVVSEDDWHSLTVKMIGNITTAAGSGIPAFVLYLDDVALSAGSDYSIGDEAALLPRLNPEARVLYDAHQLFPSRAPIEANDAFVFSRMLFDGYGSVGGLAFVPERFADSEGLAFAKDRRIFILQWDPGVKTLSYSLDGGATYESVDVAGSVRRERYLVIGNAVTVKVSVGYATDEGYKPGNFWTCSDNCTYTTGEGKLTGVFDLDEGVVYSGKIGTKRDFIDIGGAGSYGSFKEAVGYAEEQGVSCNFHLVTNMVMTKDGDDKGTATFVGKKDAGVVIDLAGHDLVAGYARFPEQSPAIRNNGGTLTIMDSAPEGVYGHVIPYMTNGIAVMNGNSAGTDTTVPRLLIKGGIFEGVVSNANARGEVEISGGVFKSDNPDEFYLAGCVVTNLDGKAMGYTYNAGYWYIGEAYTITYDKASEKAKMPARYVTMYTADTPCTALPVPIWPHQEFLYWTNEVGNVYTNIGIGSAHDGELTNLFLSAVWGPGPADWLNTTNGLASIGGVDLPSDEYFTIHLPPTDDLPAGSLVRISSVCFGCPDTNGWNKVAKYVMIDGVRSACVNGDGNISDAKTGNGAWIERYDFSELILRVGTVYAIRPCDEDKNPASTRVQFANTSLPEYGVVKVTGRFERFRPFYEVSGRVLSFGDDQLVYLDGVSVTPGTLASAARTDRSILIPSGSALSVSDIAALLPDYYSIVGSTPSGELMLSLNENALPEEFDERATLFLSEGFVNVWITNTRTGLWYGLQHKTSLDAVWEEPGAWYPGADGNDLHLQAAANEDACFYRIKVTDVDPSK